MQQPVAYAQYQHHAEGVFILIILSSVLNIVHHPGFLHHRISKAERFFLGGKIVRSGNVLVL
jgi:hypothetical protein